MKFLKIFFEIGRETLNCTLPSGQLTPYVSAMLFDRCFFDGKLRPIMNPLTVSPFIKAIEAVKEMRLLFGRDPVALTDNIQNGLMSSYFLSGKSGYHSFSSSARSIL